MNNKNIRQDLTLLFVEHGTPTFSTSRETDSLLGVGVIYKQLDEVEIFSQCTELFGLNNAAPLKNRMIKSSRAINISLLIQSLPIRITICKINLADQEFKGIVSLYEEYGTAMRQIHRKIA